MSERLTKEREAEIRGAAESEMYTFSFSVLAVLAELDATRAERDTLAECLEWIRDTAITLPGAKGRVVYDWDYKSWVAVGLTTSHFGLPTALDAIRAAMNNTTK